MQTLGSHEFQQILGAFSSRPGHGDADGIPFSEEECRMTHRYLVSNGVLCLRIDVTSDGVRLRSLIVAHTGQGLERCVRMAQKEARRHHAWLQVFRTVEAAEFGEFSRVRT
jgi:hypothetical protein